MTQPPIVDQLRGKSPAEVQVILAARLAEAEARAQATRARIAEGAATATGRDGVATVSVSATGSLTRLQLSDRAKGMSPVQLAASIMQTYRDAASQAARHTLAVVEEEAGDGRALALTRAAMPDFVFSDDEAQA